MVMLEMETEDVLCKGRVTRLAMPADHHCADAWQGVRQRRQAVWFIERFTIMHQE